jgi:hypothetical protein
VIRILTWLWAQPGARTTYTAEHVNIFASMVRRNCSLRFSLGCVTNMPDGIDPSIDIIPLPTDFEGITPRWGPRKPNCFRRLALYRRDADKIFGGKRFASFDLDCIIGGDLAPMLSRPEDFVIYRGTHPSRPYNGSLQLITAGARPQVYERFDQAGADASGDAFHGSDQAWLMHCLGPNEATWDRSDGVWHLHEYLPQARKANPTILFFPGKRKPWELHRVFPWMREHYRIVKEKEAA